MQLIDELASRWKSPFVVLKRMRKDGTLGVTYEMLNLGNVRCTIIDLKPIKVQYIASCVCQRPHNHLFNMGKTVPPTPFLSTLSGALPFLAPTPPNVPARTIPQPTPAPQDRLKPPPCPPSSTVHTATPTDSTGLPSSASAPILPLSRSGHALRQPTRCKDCLLRCLQKDLLTLVLV